MTRAWIIVPSGEGDGWVMSGGEAAIGGKCGLREGSGQGLPKVLRFWIVDINSSVSRYLFEVEMK